MALPPKPVYPRGIDSDKTLFLVYNTTETKIASDNNAWSQEIDIIPVQEDKLEIWADNGFATIEGELLYYDSVEKDSNGKVNKLKKCSRNLGGKKSKFNPSGTWIRSFVIAEHHNQLVNGIVALENFVGFNFDPRIETLDWRIRNLRNLQPIFDDHNCPDVDFTFNTIETNPLTGTVARYSVEVSNFGSLPTSNFRLDFGDGTFTTTSLSGTHRYAIGARIDPILTITNDTCQTIQSPINRTNPLALTEFTEVVLDFPIPPSPIIPPFQQIPLECPEPNLQIPPLITPCTQLELGLPSIITGPNINLISSVSITGPDINLPPVVSIVGGFELPDVIIFDNVPIIPPTVSIIGTIPSTIVIEPPSSSILFSLDIDNLPALQVDWGMPPDFKIEMTTVRPIKKQVLSMHGEEFGDEFRDIFEEEKIEYEPVPLPTEIKIIPPSEEDMTIKIDVEEIKNNIQDIGESFGKGFKKIAEEVKNTFSNSKIELESPKSIKLDVPEKIVIELTNPIPERIILDAENVPKTIEVTGIPDFIPLKFPDEMPEIPLVYKGAPIELKISMEEIMTTTTDGQKNCVMIVPCK